MRRTDSRHCSRRTFLRGSGLTLAGFGISSLLPSPLIRHALAGAANDGRRLLFIFLRGGNDGINAVIPHGDADYNATNRPSLYIPPAQAIDLNGFASLHPALGAMTDAFDAGELAVIHRAGYPNNSRSHFDGQRIWENGDPTQPQLLEGWLYRYIVENAVNQGAAIPVLTAQSSPPVLVRGGEPFVNVANPDAFGYIATEPKRTKIEQLFRGLYGDLVGLEPYRPLLSETGVKLVDMLDEYESWDQAGWDPKDPDTGWSLFPVDQATNQAGFAPGAFELFASLKVAALSLLESDPTNANGTRVVGTQLGGWDLHSNQGSGVNGRHAELLSWLAYGFKSLRVVLSGAAIDPRAYPSIWSDTVVTTLSEFGRTTIQNDNVGTDHAAASCLFVQGGGVNGGVYNCDASTWPAGVMFGVNGRYLLERTDYRAIFWELLRDHMGANPATVDATFPGYTAQGLGAQELGLVGV